MKSIYWKACIIEDNNLAILEKSDGFKQNEVESHLAIIGILETLKEQHQNKMKTLFNKSVHVSNPNVIKEDEDLAC